MALDKSDYIYISVLTIGLMFFFVWQFGAYSSNIHQSSLLNQTLLQLHEDEAREKQSKIIRDDIKEMLIDLSENFTKNVIRENNTTSKILENQDIVLKQHTKVALDHNIIQDSVQNVTNQNHELLEKILDHLVNTTNYTTIN